MAKTITIEGADLYAGAGGTSSGVLLAAEELGYKLRLRAYNHWQMAIDSHALNHPGVVHRCVNVEAIKPRQEVVGGRLRLLTASPECTHHSLANGGRRCNEQSRSGAWNIMPWLSDLMVDDLMIENVWEWRHWGPLHLDHSNGCKGNGGSRKCKKSCHFEKPIDELKGTTFDAFIQALKAMNRSVEFRRINAADYGDPQARHRLIMISRRDRKPFDWPEPTHGPGRPNPYRTAREIIDWSQLGTSIFGRKKPLCKNTMRRIAVGLEKFCGEFAQPFLVKMYGTSTVASVDNPMPTVLTSGKQLYLATPYLVNMKGQSNASSIDQPVPTVTAQAPHLYLAQPFVLGQQSAAAPRSVEEPLPTVACKGAIGMVTPFIMQVTHHDGDARRCKSLDEPLPTVTGSKDMALVRPFIIQTDNAGGNGSYVRTVDNPLPTLVSKQNLGLVMPFLTKHYGHSDVANVNEPLGTVTTKDRFGLVEPLISEDGYYVDILFRMLQPEELKLAMGFSKEYQFLGTKEDQTKQIGNAVCVNLAKAMAKALLSS